MPKGLKKINNLDKKMNKENYKDLMHQAEAIALMNDKWKFFDNALLDCAFVSRRDMVLSLKADLKEDSNKHVTVQGMTGKPYPRFYLDFKAMTYVVQHKDKHYFGGAFESDLSRGNNVSEPFYLEDAKDILNIFEREWKHNKVIKY